MSLFRKKLGDSGENTACNFLRNKGYKILQRNYRKKCGEIDIIAEENDELVFIEVKTRSSSDYGSPLAAVTPRKQQQIIKTAQTYLTETDNFDRAARFDVIAILQNDKTSPQIEQIIGAFEL